MIGLSFRNLFRNLRRTIAVLLTVALGAGALFSFQGFINGVLTDYQESMIHAHYGNGQINTKGYRETVYQKPWNHWIDNADEISSFLAKNPEVEHIFPRISIGGMLVHDKVSITGQGQGIDAQEEAQFFNALNIDEGETLTNQPNGILLGEGLAKALDVHPGDKITLYTKSTTGGIGKGKFTVTGVFHTGNADFDKRVFRIQITEAQRLLKTTQVESISLGLTDQTHWNAVSQSVAAAFPGLETASFAELDKIYYQNSVDWLKTQFYVVQIIILSIVLLGIFNTISASILERKQEIGNFRANGESTFDILKLIIGEGAILGLVGSLIGIGLTEVVAKGFLHQKIMMPPGPGSSHQFFISFYFTVEMAIKTVALSILSALVASFLAGIKVARMPIAKALRSY
ncbi:MAG: ABC transporter permease [Candidatus Melainabacteria bacterium]|nr:ABC transporter permease [Candidatus Melainabacteria bacterium]